jgi:hypothetical protein
VLGGIEMGSDAIIHIPGFVKIGSGIQKVMRGEKTYRHTDSKVVS